MCIRDRISYLACGSSVSEPSPLFVFNLLLPRFGFSSCLIYSFLFLCRRQYPCVLLKKFHFSLLNLLFFLFTKGPCLTNILECCDSYCFVKLYISIFPCFIFKVSMDYSTDASELCSENYLLNQCHFFMRCHVPSN